MRVTVPIHLCLYLIPHRLHLHLHATFKVSLHHLSPSLSPLPPPVINCALGLWRFVESSQDRHKEQFYLYIVLLVVVVVFEVGMGVYHFVAKYIKPDLSKPPKDPRHAQFEDLELTEATNDKNSPKTENKDKPAPKKQPSKARAVPGVVCFTSGLVVPSEALLVISICSV